MKIYTKTGDKGQTSLIGGKRVPKHYVRIEAYGTIDELIAFTGLLRDQPIDKDYKSILLQVQDDLMVCAAILATDSDDSNLKIPTISEEQILMLEHEIDKLETNLSPLNSFIIPGGHPSVSYCHVARTVCRRAERHVIKLMEESFAPEVVLKYLNRLSDYFFVLARKISSDLQVVEYYWVAKL